MYPDSKLTNKKAIVWLTRITILILFIVGSFGFGDKAYTDTSIYDFFSGARVSNWAYEKGGSQPASPTDYTSEAFWPDDYNNISSSNNVRWDTMLATNNDWDSQIYTFTINEFIDTITSLTLEWEGYGETASVFLTHFYIWNQNSSTWEPLDSLDFTSASDITLTGSITTNIRNYINPVTKKLTIMAATQRAKQLGESCVLSTECASGYCVDGVCCNETCGGDCEACDLAGSVGTCTSVEDGTDPEGDCGTGCQRCVSGSCQDYSDICSAIDCYTGSCVSDACTIYSGGEKGTCTTCQYCNDSDAACDNWPNNTQAGGCNATCQACQSGSCGYATAGTDPGSHCTNPVSGSKTTGCATGNCNSSHVCGVYTSGDQNCPVCWTCTDSDIACEKHNISYRDTCPVCKACDASGDCSDVLTENTDTDTGWGFNLYGCISDFRTDNKRCYSGVCRTCESPGYIYDDGCINCAGQGGKACWRYGGDPGIFNGFSCNTACGTRGCVQANWNDTTSCSVCRHWWSTANCSTFASGYGYVPAYYNLLGTDTCHYRPSGTSQNCGLTTGEGWSRRLCVCNW
ncbi:MAG: hypothetical protein ACKKMR_03310 [Candidatus Nealsonbacteria bacterium]